jgi:hypothetical protein
MAVAVEAICSPFGIYGVGWLMSDKTAVGIPLLIGDFVWAAIVIIGTIFTAGIGLCRFGPLHLIFIAPSTVLLANQTVR